MRVVTLAAGTAGDVRPVIALAAGLRAAGHEVTLATHPEYRDRIESLGLGYYPIPGDFRRILTSAEGLRWLREGRGLRPRRVARVIRDVFGAQMPSVLRSLRYACGGAEAVVTTPLLRGAAWVAEAARIPCALAVVMGPWARTARAPHPLAPTWLRRVPGASRASQLVLERATYWDPFADELAAFRESLGLGPISPAEAGRRSLGLPRVLALGRAVAPALDDLGPDALVTGFWVDDGGLGWSPSPELSAFVAAGAPPIAVGFSTGASVDADAAAMAAVAAARARGRRIVVLRGAAELTPVPGDDVLVTDRVPHSWLLPRCAAVVHHGGAGTTSAAFRAGVPQVVLPQGNDQPYWASRVAALGCGPPPIAPARANGPRLARALAIALSVETGRRGRATARALAGEDGVGEGARFLSARLAGEAPREAVCA